MNTFLCLSFWTINFDAVFENLFVNLFALINRNEVCNSNNGSPKKTSLNSKKSHSSNWLTLKLETFVLKERGNEKWLNMRWFSFQKIDLLFDQWDPVPNRPISRDIRCQNILPVINAINRGSTSNHYHHENGSTIDVFLKFLVQTLIIGRNGNGKHCGLHFFLF